VALLFFVVGRSFLHRLPELQTSLGLNIDLTQFWPHLGLSLLTLIIPASIPMLVYGLMQLFHLLYQNLESKIPNPKPRRFVELAYGYLPLVLEQT